MLWSKTHYVTFYTGKSTQKVLMFTFDTINCSIKMRKGDNVLKANKNNYP